MITVTADWTPFARYLTEVQRKRLPYATAIATTALAQRAQIAVRSSLSHSFETRSSWISRGIRIERGEMRDWPAVQSVIGSVDWFMESQETGEDREPRGGRKNLSVPGPGIRPTKATKIPRGKWPKALLKKKGYRQAFIQKLTQGAHKGKMAVLRRSTNDRYPLEVLYVFEPRTKGKKRLHMQEIVTKVVARNHALVFQWALARALAPRMRTARLL